MGVLKFFKKKKPKKFRKFEPVQPRIEDRVLPITSRPRQDNPQPGQGLQGSNLYGMSGGEVALVAVVGCGAICQIVASAPALAATTLCGVLYYADKWITGSNEIEKEKWKTLDGMRASGMLENGSNTRRGQRVIEL